jgi:hypothetical protein
MMLEDLGHSFDKNVALIIKNGYNSAYQSKGGERMKEFLAGIPVQLVDFVIYGAIALVMLIAVFKCIVPLRNGARLFRRAVRSLELMTAQEGTRPAWQDVQFLGKPMQQQWKRFLMNAEQLDARGLSCDVEQYINDDDVFTDYARLQLAEVVPGFLTSLGILGTFIGLMRGIGNLDVTSATNTMESISVMIGGISFAYGTSIAGLVCSLVFSILLRISQGSALGAMDDFVETFRELVMHRPMDENVHSICHMEDQAAFLSRTATDLNNRLASGIEVAIDRAFTPISQSINSFILAETQGQMEGLSRIVGHFISQMNNAMGGQFVQLAKTLSGINQAQAVSFETINHTITAADAIMESIQRTHAVTQAVIERFDSYVNSLAQAQTGNTGLVEEMSTMLVSMHAALQQHSDQYARLQAGQADIEQQMQQYASWSGRVLEAVEKQSDAAADRTHLVANEMTASSQKLADSYTGFVENISTGLARTMGMFEENMHDMMDKLFKQLSSMAQPEGSTKGGQVVELTAISKMQQAMADMTVALNRAVIAVEKLAEGA